MTQPTLDQLISIAVKHHQAGQLADAARIYRQVLGDRPDHPHALHLLGVVAMQSGRPDVAVELIRRAIAIDSSHADFHSNLGTALNEARHPDQAVTAYRQSLRLRPATPETYSNMGNALTALGQIEAAIAAYREALRLRPAYADALNNLGSALTTQRKFDEAIACLRQALNLNVSYPAAWNNLANALRCTGDFDGALQAYGQALRLKGDYADAYNGMGLACEEKGDTDGALQAICEAVRLNPNLADAHTNLAMHWLLRGDFERGWPEYEWRWQLKGAPLPQTSFVQPRWKGEDLNGRTVLLYAEQGVGDTIQFIRYAPLVKQRGGRVMFVCMPEVAPLLVNFAGVDEMVPQGTLPPFHLHCPLLSLPMIFNTRVETIPASVPYLKADPRLSEQWSMKLQSRPGRLKVGLAWAGRPTHADDARRSMRLAQLAPLAQVKGVTFFSLQKGEAAAESARAPAGMDLIDCAADLHDFADTAALVSQLDLVVAVDTAVAHLAGAMGKPVWVLLPFKPDWRWLLDRNDTPWYPTMRLFRQGGKREWDGVTEEVAKVLHDWSSGMRPQ